VQAPGTPAAIDTDNVFAAVLDKISVPEGWTVRPCEGSGPFLCVFRGPEVAGALQLSVYPIETMPDFQRMLTDTGLQPGQLDPADPAQRAMVLAALESFVGAYHSSIERDRQVEYGGKIHSVRLVNQPVMVGSLPGVRYGFAGVNDDGSTFERWISYVAYDGDLMYTVVASFRPGAIPTFRSDEELTEFLPHLDQIVAGLRLPLPVVPATVTSVRALRPLDIFRSYSAEAGNPVGQVAAGQTVTVKGASPNGRHWLIDCPDPALRACWISGTPGATDPPVRQESLGRDRRAVGMQLFQLIIFGPRPARICVRNSEGAVRPAIGDADYIARSPTGIG
jgi:hypothetical protein